MKPGLTNRGVQIVHDVYVYGSELQRSSGEFGVYVGWANYFFFNLYYSGNWMKGDFVYSYTQPVVSHVKFTWEESHVNFTWSVTWNSHEIKKKSTPNSPEIHVRWILGEIHVRHNCLHIELPRTKKQFQSKIVIFFITIIELFADLGWYYFRQQQRRNILISMWHKCILHVTWMYWLCTRFVWGCGTRVMEIDF